MKLPRIKRICKFCQKEFFVKRHEVARGNGIYCSIKCLWGDASNRQLGSNNSNWKGEKVGYKALHEWVKRRLLQPAFCQSCNKVPPYDLANISQEYKRDISDWEWLCRKCHMSKDKRIEPFLDSAIQKQRSIKANERFLI